MSRYERGRSSKPFADSVTRTRRAPTTIAAHRLLINDAVTYAEAVMVALDEKERAADVVDDAAAPTEPLAASDPTEPLTTGETSVSRGRAGRSGRP